MFDHAVYQRLAALLQAHGWSDGFYLQHYRDARVAEQATAATKPVALAMALAGLLLAVERGWDGRAVQDGHGRLAKGPVATFSPAHERVAWSADDVARFPTPDAFTRWLAAVWAAYANQHDAVRAWVDGALPGAGR